jgi:hypothetical protein
MAYKTEPIYETNDVRNKIVYTDYEAANKIDMTNKRYHAKKNKIYIY